MPLYRFPPSTSVGFPLNGAATDPQVAYLRALLSALSSAGGGAGAPYDLDTLTNSLPAVPYTDVETNVVQFMWGHIFDSPLAGDGMLFGHAFGLEAPEFMAWWLQGGGKTVVEAELATLGEDVVMFPMPRFGESTGWYKEAVTLKKMVEGKYNNGETIKYRHFGDGQAITNRAFPLVVTPPSTGAGVPFLSDVFGGTFNGGEFGDATMDASPTNGLFPNWPNVEGSIIDALGGRPHYYVGSWHTPTRMQALFVNKTFYTGLPVQDQKWIEAAATAAAMDQLAQAQVGQDALIQIMQSLGAVIHEQLPVDVLSRFRDAAGDFYEEQAAASVGSSGTGDSFAKVGSVMTLTDAGAAFTPEDVGRKISISNAASPGNNGEFVITARTAITVDYVNADGVAEADATVDWAVSGTFKNIYDSQQAFIKANQVRHRAQNDRSFRYARRQYQATLVPNVRVYNQG